MNLIQWRGTLGFCLCSLTLFVESNETSHRDVYLTMDARMGENSASGIENLGGVLTSDAVKGQALLFENRSCMDVSANRLRWLGATDFTISLWVKVLAELDEEPRGDGLSADRVACVLDKRDSTGGIMLKVNAEGFTFAISNDEDYKEALKNEVIPFPTSVERNEEWWHFLLKAEGRFYEVWLNGERCWQKELQQVLSFRNQSFLRVACGVSGDSFFRGIIDEVRIESRAWQMAEIREYYQQIRRSKE